MPRFNLIPIQIKALHSFYAFKICRINSNPKSNGIQALNQYGNMSLGSYHVSSNNNKFVSDTEGRHANAKAQEAVDHLASFCEVERRFHSRESHRQPRP